MTKPSETDLLVVETHPVQYHAPVYRRVEQDFGIRVCQLYGSDYSIAGYHDAMFASQVAWDPALIRGTSGCEFLSRVAEGGARDFDHVGAYRLGQRIRQLDPKVILIAGYRPNFYLRALWFAQRQRIPVLLRAETTDHTPVRGRLKQVLRDRFLRSIYRSCSRLLAVGARSLEHYRRLGCPEYKIVFSPYCVDTSPFATGDDSQRMLRPTTRAQLGVNPSDIVVLFSGKLCDRKRPDLLVKAVRTLPGDLRLRVSIVCLGDGPDRLRLEQEAAREPAVRLFVVGFKNQSELSPYYHAADLLCLPSQAETWGLVVNEALHHGLSCVVSHAVGSWPDLIKPGVTGEVFRAGSISGLAEALQRNFVYAGADATREHCLAAVAHYGVQQAAAGIAQACRDVTGTRQLMADPLDAPVATGARR